MSSTLADKRIDEPPNQFPQQETVPKAYLDGCPGAVYLLKRSGAWRSATSQRLRFRLVPVQGICETSVP